jgi:hypothetical protein
VADEKVAQNVQAVGEGEMGQAHRVEDQCSAL